MDVEYGVGGDNFWLFEEESLEAFAVAVGNGKISADNLFTLNLPRLGAICGHP